MMPDGLALHAGDGIDASRLLAISLDEVLASGGDAIMPTEAGHSQPAGAPKTAPEEVQVSGCAPKSNGSPCCGRQPRAR